MPNQLRRLRLSLPDGDDCLSGEMAFFERGDESLGWIDFGEQSYRARAKEKPEALFHRYLDLNACERAVLWTLRRARPTDLIILAGSDWHSLFDAPRELLIAGCARRDNSDIPEMLLRILAETDPSRRPSPDPERLSHDLARWSELFVGSIGPVLKWARSDVERLARQALLGFKVLAHRMNEPGEWDTSAGLGLSCSAEQSVLQAKWDPPSAADLLDATLAAAAEYAPSRAGAFDPLERGALRRQMIEILPEKIAPVNDITRLAAAKLETPVQQRALLPLEQEHTSWRLALIEPLQVDEHIAAHDFYVFQPLELDLCECGFGRVLEATEKLAAFGLAESEAIQKAGGRQPDLFADEPAEVNERQALVDPFNWLLLHALRLNVAPAYREIAAYLLASHILDLCLLPRFRPYRPRALTSLPALFRQPQP